MGPVELSEIPSQQSWQVCFSSHTNQLHFLCMCSFPLIKPNCLFHFSPWPPFQSKTLRLKVFLSVMSAWVLLVAFFYSWNPFHSLSLFSWSRRFHSFDKPVKLKYMFPHVCVKACLYMLYYFWNKPLTFIIIWATFSINSR